MEIKTRIRFIGFVGLLVVMAVLTSCGGREKDGGKDSDSVAVAPVVEKPVEVKEAYITREGIDTIRVGMKITDIPEQVEGLYDAFNPGADIRDIEALQYDFSLDGNVRFSVLDFGEGKVDVVFVGDYSVGVEQPDGADPIVMGDKFSRVLDLKGVTSKWNPYDSMGFWAWEWNGVWFMVDKEGINEQNSMKLFNPDKAPSKADLANIKVGYIGTGLPF